MGTDFPEGLRGSRSLCLSTSCCHFPVRISMLATSLRKASMGSVRDGPSFCTFQATIVKKKKYVRVHHRFPFQFRASRFDLMHSWLCAFVCAQISVVLITLMYSRSSGFPHQIAQLRAGCCEIQTCRVLEGSEAASDVFLDGLNNECLKRLRGPQLPKTAAPLPDTHLFASSRNGPEKQGDAGSEGTGRRVSPPPHPSTF